MLKKTLYGVKKYPKAQFGSFARVIKALGYKESQDDHTLFVKHSNSRGVTTLLVYADNIVVTRDDLQKMQALQRCLLQEFEIKELDRLKYFPNIEVAHS